MVRPGAPEVHEYATDHTTAVEYDVIILIAETEIAFCVRES